MAPGLATDSEDDNVPEPDLATDFEDDDASQLNLQASGKERNFGNELNDYTMPALVSVP